MSDIVYDDMIEDEPSDTPRTDAAAFVAGNFSGKHDVVTVNFAEQLERELNAAKAEQLAMLQQTKELHVLIKQLEQKLV